MFHAKGINNPTRSVGMKQIKIQWKKRKRKW